MIVLLGLLTLALDDVAPVVPAFSETLRKLPGEGVGILLYDFTGDGALDLLQADATGLALFPLGADGTYPSEPACRMEWPGERVGWDVGDLDGDGVGEIVMVLDDGRVLAHRADAAGVLDEGEVLVEARVELPAGVTHAAFVRDVDGDARGDLVLPSRGAHRIHLAGDEGWAAPVEVAYELDSSYKVGDPRSLSAAFGQKVRVPWFRIEDVDGDGRNDLVSSTSERVAFHLADPQPSSTASWVLDLEALRDELPSRDPVDFDNLFSAAGQRVLWRLAELDGKAPRDLIVVVGSKFRVYLGGARTGPTGTPDQVLKSSGNVLSSYVRQVEGDELPDLQVVRAERVSVGRVLRALILPSALDFDVFTYENVGGTFSRRPTRRNRITIEIPRLSTFIGDTSGLELRLQAQMNIPARRLPRVPGAPAAGDDVLDFTEDRLEVYAGCAPAPAFIESLAAERTDEQGVMEGLFLEDLDAREDGATRTLDLGEIDSLDLSPGAILRRARAGREAEISHPLAFGLDALNEARTRDLDGDGVSDVILVGRTDEGWSLQFLVRRR